MKEVYLLFNGDLVNGHYDALSLLEGKKTGTFFINSFTHNLH